MAFPSPSHAASGAVLFTQSCSGCHAGGGNLFNSQKTLKQEALAKYGYATVEQMTEIIYAGKGQVCSSHSFVLTSLLLYFSTSLLLYFSTSLLLYPAVL
jgi:hypothetical protein